MDLCSCMITGRLTSDGELKYTQGGAPSLRFSVAVGRYRAGRQETSFFDCSAWGKGAEVLAPRMAKGSPVAVRGEMRQERWNDMDGAARSRWVLVADTFGVQVMPKPKNDGAGGQEHRKGRGSRRVKARAVRRPRKNGTGYRSRRGYGDVVHEVPLQMQGAIREGPAACVLRPRAGREADSCGRLEAEE